MARPATKEQITKRREQVAQLYFMGNYTISEIAKALDWDDSVIWFDIKYLRSQNVMHAKDKVSEVFVKIIERKEKMIKRAYNGLAKTKNEKEERAWMSTIKELDQQLVQDLIYAGIIPKPTDRVMSASVTAEVPMSINDIKNTIVKIINENGTEEQR